MSKVRATFKAGESRSPLPEPSDRATVLVEDRPAGPSVQPMADRSAPDEDRPRPDAPTWLLGALAVVATAIIAATAWVWLTDDAGDADAARAAQTAAEKAVVPVLSYDHEDLEGSQRAAQALMTGSYREEYDKLFAVIAENAPTTQTTVEVEVLASGVVRANDDRVHVLVFVDRPTTNKLSPEPVVYKDQVTLSMQRVDGEWLVDDMVTSPAAG